MSRWLLPLAVLLPLVLGCAAGEAESEDPPVAERSVTVSAIEVTPRRVVDRAAWSADLRPLRRATLAAEVAGTVEDLAAEMGDRVAAGAVLARIDTRALRQQVAEAEAVFRQAETLYATAESLFDKRSITRERLIVATTDRDVAAARLESARLNLSKSEVKAPWAGEVASRRVEIGDYVTPGQPILELVGSHRLKVTAPVPAGDVPYLSVGMPVEVTVDVLPGERFGGRIVRLGAELDPDSRTLPVEAEIANPERQLKPGMFGRMEASRRTLEAALVVPLSAVVDFERSKVVYLVHEGVARRRPVVLGPVLGEEVVVKSGLEASDRVIVRGQQQVSDGQPVELREGA